MGLLSKLLGSKAEKEMKDLFKGLSNEAKKNENRPEDNGNAYGQNYQNTQEAPASASGPSGFSWGPAMPAEENQYNYGGSYIDYFREIFNSNFSEYRIEQVQEGTTTIFTFYSGDRVALKVELLSKNTGRYGVRKECAEKNIPYLRYYYNYEGWWNTKRYVIERTSKALGK